MPIVKVDKRRYVVLEKEAITDFKKAVKDHYPGDSVQQQRIIGMIEYYCGGSSIDELPQFDDVLKVVSEEVKGIREDINVLKKNLDKLRSGIVPEKKGG